MTTKVPARMISSGTSPDGQVLTSDGAGVAAFEPSGFPKNIFAGYRTAGNVTSPAIFICNVAEVNQNTVYNTTTGVYTAPATGLYEVSGNFIESTSTAAAFMQVYKNGVALPSIYVATQSGSISLVVSLTLGDTLYLFAGPTSGRTIIGTGGPYNYIIIKQIG